jgi:hypothetical protein
VSEFAGQPAGQPRPLQRAAFATPAAVRVHGGRRDPPGDPALHVVHRAAGMREQVVDDRLHVVVETVQAVVGQVVHAERADRVVAALLEPPGQPGEDHRPDDVVGGAGEREPLGVAGRGRHLGQPARQGELA